MAQNNLRILYRNQLDEGTLTAISNTIATGAYATITCSSAASAATGAVNLTYNAKSKVWRSATSSTTSVKANMVITFPATVVGGVILPFCNLTTSATIRVRGYIGTAPTLGGTVDTPTTSATGTLVFDTGSVLACPTVSLGVWDWGTTPLGINSYAYGGGTYGRVWVPIQTSCTSILIEIVDTNPSRYIELSRVVIGPYWSPKFNTEYGLSSSRKDTSVHTRTESGDLITTRGVQYRTMNFSLNYLTSLDRTQLLYLLAGNGMSRPLFISLFPNNSDDYSKEQEHQIYGKLSQLNDITHPMFSTYATSIDIEEI